MQELLAGYGESNITPEMGLELSGYGYHLSRKATGVLDDIKIRAVYLTDGEEVLLLMSCDLLGFSLEYADDLRQSIADDLGIPARSIAAACTHTHAAPVVQNLMGLGEPSPEYIKQVHSKAREAARRAAEDAAPAKACFAQQMIEPIGYNRRNGNFKEIDPMLSEVVLVRKQGNICLLNYACHAVTLGATDKITADWPGAVVRAMEHSGQKAIIFQGFCGDVNPTARLYMASGQQYENLALYGSLICDRAMRLAKIAEPLEARLSSAEERINLPLSIPSEDELEKFKEGLKTVDCTKGIGRFQSWWVETALKNLPKYKCNPYLENVPIHGMKIGSLNLLALPGEVFSQMGVGLRKTYPQLFTLGYCNGNAGYIPTKAAYGKTKDYACYDAPKFYSIFPFTPQVYDIMEAAGRRVLGRIA
jgi:hypothetical protein